MAQLLNLKITFEYSELYTSAKKLQLCYSNSLGQASSKSFSILGSISYGKQSAGIAVQDVTAQMSWTYFIQSKVNKFKMSIERFMAFKKITDY